MTQVTQAEVLKVIKELSFMANLDIDCEKNLKDQGVDSLDMIQTLFQIQEHYNFDIPEESIANNEWSSVNKIVAKINSMKNN